MFKKKYGRVLIFTLAVIVALSASSITASAAGVTPPTNGSGYIIMKVDSKNMDVNGVTVEVDPGRKTAPVLIDDRTMIPARALTEAIGGKVGWNETAQSVTLSVAGNTVVMVINQKEYAINGAKRTMDVAPILLGERTLIPLRFAAEALGCNVKWFGDTNEILVTYIIAEKQPYSYGLDKNGFFIGIRALDYVDISGYHAMKIPNDLHQDLDNSVQEAIDSILGGNLPTKQVTNRAIVKGDMVNIDFVGSIGGIKFEGGSTNGEGEDVIIGETQYIDNFLDQLIGHKPGETVNVKVTFPKDYFEESLQGKAALFVTTINFIIENGELTDEFVAEILSDYYGWTTIAEMKAAIRLNLQKESFEDFIIAYLNNDVTIRSMPDSLMAYQERTMLHYYQNYADSYGIDLIELLGYEGVSSVEELFEAYRDGNYQSAKYYLVIQAIAEDKGISVSTEDIEAFLIATDDSSDIAELEVKFGMPHIKHTVLCQKVLDYVIKNAVFG